MSEPSTIDEATVQRLVDIAIDARSRAYVPYTEFDAGAGVLDANGDIFAGSVVENVSLGLAMCAERAAMFAAVSGRETELRALVLAAPNTGDGPTFPCGGCCQVALELGGPDMTIVVIDPGGDRITTTIGALLPNGPKVL